MLDERRRRVAARQARPLQFAESVRDAFVRLRRAVDDDREQEGLVRRDQVGAIDRQLPLEPEVAFDAIMGIRGDDREEQGAGFDVLANRGVPGVPTAQLALIESHLDVRGTQRSADLLCGSGIFGRIAEKDGSLALPGCGDAIRHRFVPQEVDPGVGFLERSEWTRWYGSANARPSRAGHSRRPRQHQEGVALSPCENSRTETTHASCLDVIDFVKEALGSPGWK